MYHSGTVTTTFPDTNSMRMGISTSLREQSMTGFSARNSARLTYASSVLPSGERRQTPTCEWSVWRIILVRAVNRLLPPSYSVSSR